MLPKALRKYTALESAHILSLGSPLSTDLGSVPTPPFSDLRPSRLLRKLQVWFSSTVSIQKSTTPFSRRIHPSFITVTSHRGLLFNNQFISNLTNLGMGHVSLSRKPPMPGL